MIVTAKKSTLNGKIDAIPSKSFAHRSMICSFLSGNTEYLGVENFSADIVATKNCLIALDSAIKNNTSAILDAGESGSTLRFMLPISCLVENEITFVGHGKLMDRPIGELFSVLSSHGVLVKKENGVITKSGKLTAGEFYIKGDISSQYLTGLLLTLPKLDGDSVIIPTTPLVSRPYIDITLSVLSSFGVLVTEKDGKFFIKGNQAFNGNLTVEGDWSNSAFYLVAGVIGGDITVKNLNFNSVQGDKKIVEIIKSAGGNITNKEGEYTAKKSDLTAFTFSAKDCPDLVPICAVLGAFSKGKTVIKDIERLKIKESDRVLSTIALLTNIGIKAKEENNSLIIEGGPILGGTVSSFNDHRIAMSAIIAGVNSENGVVLTDALAVNKSYPNFYKDTRFLGGIIDEEN